MKIRGATREDLLVITEIYNEAILKTTATFDTVPKTIDEQQRWFDAHDAHHPVLVAEDANSVMGWGSLSRWSDRCAYSGTAENSVYVIEAKRGRGIGKALLGELLKSAEITQLHTVIARIADGNAASVRLHEHFGFFPIGIMREVGCKFGRMLDVHLMQKIIGKAGSDTETTNIQRIFSGAPYATRGCLEPQEPRLQMAKKIPSPGSFEP